jgi:transposase
MDVSTSSVFLWLARYRSGGWDGLKTGKRSGRPAKIKPFMMKWIYDTVTDGDPRQLGFDFALWTIPMIGRLIRDNYGIKLSRWSISRLLKQLGLTPQRPVWRVWQQDPGAVKRWQSRQFRRCGHTPRGSERRSISAMRPASAAITMPERHGVPAGALPW